MNRMNAGFLVPSLSPFLHSRGIVFQGFTLALGIGVAPAIFFKLPLAVAIIDPTVEPHVVFGEVAS
jgi:hypothetical protein